MGENLPSNEDKMSAEQRSPTIELSQVPAGQYDARQHGVFTMSAKEVRACSCGDVSDVQYTKCKCGSDLSKRAITERWFLECEVLINVKTDQAQSLCVAHLEIRADDGVLFKENDKGSAVKAIDVAKRQVSAMGFDLSTGWEPVLADIARTSEGKPKVFKLDVKVGQKGTKYVQIATGPHKVALTGDKRRAAVDALNALSGIKKVDPDAY
jgi:hypothetical protein